MNPVRWARFLLALIGVSHLVVPLVMWTARDTLRAEIASQHPEFGPEALDTSVSAALTAATVFHGVLLVLCALLVWRLGSGQPWTRRLATISQALSVVFSVVSWSSSPMFHAVIPLIGAAQIAIIVLLWAPRSSREFYAVSSLRPG